MPDLAKIIAEAYKIFGKATLSKVLSKARMGAGSVGEAIKEFHKSQGTGIKPLEPPKPASAYRGFQFEELRPETQREIIEQEQRQSVSQKLKSLPGWPSQQRKQAPEPIAEDEPLVNMTTDMIPVSSSNVHSIGFRYETADIGTLLVRYLGTNADGTRSGLGSLYEYFDVPSLLFERFKQAASKGKFVWDELRIRGTISGHKYNYDLAGVAGGYVPRRAQLIQFRGPRGGLRATEAFVKRTFNLGEIRKGRLQIRRVQSQLPEQRLGRSFAVRRGRR